MGTAHLALRRGAALLAIAVLWSAGCGGDEPASTEGPTGSAADADYRDRLDELQAAVDVWSDAATIEEAHAAAETAANLVVGPNGPGFGDRDGDGSVGGDTARGLLPGVDGTPAGIAEAHSDSECVTRDVLGSTAADAGEGWEEMMAAIDEAHEYAGHAQLHVDVSRGALDC